AVLREPGVERSEAAARSGQRDGAITRAIRADLVHAVRIHRARARPRVGRRPGVLGPAGVANRPRVARRLATGVARAGVADRDRRRLTVASGEDPSEEKERRAPRLHRGSWYQRFFHSGGIRPVARSPTPSQAPPVTSERALIELSARLPSDALITDRDVLERYARDESEADAVLPGAVVRARASGAVSALPEVAHRHAIPVTARAGGTGRTGAAVPSRGATVLSLEGFDRVRDIDPDDMIARVEPGAITGEVHSAVEREGLFYGPDPNSLGSCTIGGNVATNAGGPRAVKYGVTRDWIR